MHDIPRALAAELPRVHEWQERQEVANVLAAGLGPTLGVQTRDWGDGLWSVRSAGKPAHQPGNQLMGFRPAHLDRLAPILAWFDAAGCAVHLRVDGPAVAPAVGDGLARLGFHAHELEAWMAAPIGAPQPLAPGVSVREVRTEADAAAFRAAFVAGWGITDPSIQRLALAAVAPFPPPPGWRQYVATVDGAPAGQALLVQRGALAYLAQAATDPRFRRRGVQRALIGKRTADARAAGASTRFGCVVYGDQSWANMRAQGLREAHLSLTFRRPPRGAAGCPSTGTPE